jgi:ABC-type transport system involved in cytochrome c biogenesis permease subunit
MFSSLGDEGRAIISALLILIPACLYILVLLQGRTGRLCFIGGLLLHLVSIISRGMEVGTIPVTERHDIISLMALTIALIWLLFSEKFRDIKGFDYIVPSLITVFLFIALGHRTVNTVPPIQQSLWFYIHTLLFSVSYGIFAFSAALGVMHLYSGKPNVELLHYRSVLLGWVVYSFCLLAGSIWFFLAYGTYWLWTSKELWSTITWFLYGMYLHSRYLKGLSGRPATIIGLLSFGAALFTYFAIGPGKVIQAPPTQF